MGKANHCDFCTVPAKAYHWAIKASREYSRNPDDYYSLCASCHKKYDLPRLTPEARAKLGKAWLGAKFSEERKHKMAVNHPKKLPESTIEEILRLRKAKYTLKEISQMTNVSTNAICRYIRNRVYKGVKRNWNKVD